MKVALFTLLAFGLIAVCRSAEEEYEYDDEPVAPAAAAPPPPPVPAQKAPPSKLGGLLSPRGRAPAVGRKPSSAATSTTTAKPVEQSVEEYDEEAVDESQEQEELPTTTTESPKKIRGGVRPFRSNEDLLAALKRRRAQVGTGSHSRESHVSPSESATQKPKTTPANRNNKSDTTTPKTPGRSRFGAGSRGNKPVQEEVEETQQDEIQVKPKPYRRG